MKRDRDDRLPLEYPPPPRRHERWVRGAPLKPRRVSVDEIVRAVEPAFVTQFKRKEVKEWQDKLNEMIRQNPDRWDEVAGYYYDMMKGLGGLAAWFDKRQYLSDFRNKWEFMKRLDPAALPFQVDTFRRGHRAVNPPGRDLVLEPRMHSITQIEEANIGWGGSADVWESVYPVVDFTRTNLDQRNSFVHYPRLRAQNDPLFGQWTPIEGDEDHVAYVSETGEHGVLPLNPDYFPDE